MPENTKIEMAAKPPYFVASTAWSARTPKQWVETKAKTIDGAKRLAAKLPRHLTATVEVAVETCQGQFETIAALEDCSAITRRRPTWRTFPLKAGHDDFALQTNPIKVLALPESERAYAKMIADWENMIIDEANYILTESVKHPVNDIRASRRAIDLAKARRIIIDLHPDITDQVLTEVHSIIDKRWEAMGLNGHSCQ